MLKRADIAMGIMFTRFDVVQSETVVQSSQSEDDDGEEVEVAETPRGVLSRDVHLALSN